MPGVTGLRSEQYATRRAERTNDGLWAMRGSKRSHSGGCQVRPLTPSCSFSLQSIARALEEAGALGRAAGCSWGLPWGRGARVEVRRVWGVGGVVPIAVGAWVFVPSPHHVLLLCCLLPAHQNKKGLRVGLLVALGGCYGAVVRVLR